MNAARAAVDIRPDDTIERVISAGALVRPTIYTPSYVMTDDVSEEASPVHNRQLFVEGLVDKYAARQFCQLCYANATDGHTAIMESIPGKTAVATNHDI